MIDEIIDSELCVGCGACTVGSDVSMKWNRLGFLEPFSTERLLENSYKLCPFNTSPDADVRTEDELSTLFLNEATDHEIGVGRYLKTYVGYANQFRKTSSSGGIATYILSSLLNNGDVDYVLSVGSSTENHYDYQICTTQEELLSTSKTKYYPVSMSTVLKYIENNDGRYAVVGTACFVKAIRLLQHYNPKFKERIKFVVGIICGGQKSKYYADFLAANAGAKIPNYSNPQFRVKNETSYALDYSFQCIENNAEVKSVKMQTLGDMWGSGLFKNNACDFCDDVTSELADISLGDAWLKPYSNDGKGTNVIVTRSKLADNLILSGKKHNELSIEELPIETFMASQQGSFNHRHKALKFRKDTALKNNRKTPPKRFDTTDISYDFKLVQKQRLKVRKLSLEYWVTFSDDFNRRISSHRNRLRALTRINHYIRAIKKRLL